MRKRILAVLMTVVMLLGTCVVSVSAADSVAANVAKIGNTEYATLQLAVTAAKDSSETDITITLLRDVPDGIGVKLEDTATKTLTIDFAGYTYTGATNPVGSSGSPSQLFHLNAPNYTITMKNGTINTSNPGQSHWAEGSTGGTCECASKPNVTGTFKMLIQNYANLNLEKMTVDFTNPEFSTCKPSYAVSNNSGAVTIKDSKIAAANGCVAFDVYRANTEKNTTVTVVNSDITGTVEVDVPGTTTVAVLSIDDASVIKGDIKLLKKSNNAFNIIKTTYGSYSSSDGSFYKEVTLTFVTKEGYLTLANSGLNEDELEVYLQYYPISAKEYKLGTMKNRMGIVPVAKLDNEHEFNGYYLADGTKVTYSTKFYEDTTLYAGIDVVGNNIFNTAWYTDMANTPYLLDKPIKVTTTSNEGGEISFNSTRAIYYMGDTLNGKVTVEDGYELESFQVNGVDYALKANNTFSMKITKDTALVATFKSTAPVTEDAAADTTVEVEAEVTEEVVEEEVTVEAAPVVKSFSLASMSR